MAVVDRASPSRTSHFWALSKDAEGSAKKAFAGTIVIDERKKLTSFIAAVPNFHGSEFSIRFTRFYKDDEREKGIAKGLIVGVVTDGNGEPKHVFGQGYFYKNLSID